MNSANQTSFGLLRSNQLLGALPGGQHVLGTLIGISAVLNVLLLSGSIFMLMVYDEVLPSHSIPSLIGLGVMLVMAYAFQGALEYQRHCIAASAGDRFDQELSPRVFEVVLQSELANGGRDAGQPIRDLDLLRGFFAGPGPVAVLDLPWMALFMGVLFTFHWILGVVCLVGALIVIVLTVFTDRLTTAQVEAATRANIARLDFAEVSRRNAEAIRALGMTDRFVRNWRALGDEHAAVNDSASEKMSLMRTFSKTFRLLLQSLMLATGAALVISGEASGGVIIASSILSSRALAPIDAAIANWKNLISARQAWNRLAFGLGRGAVPIGRTELPAPQRSLEVEDLGALAPGGQLPLFSGVNFALEAGETLAVVGASGSGKSSLMRTLVGVIPPARGTFRLDGATLDQWEHDVSGAFIGYLPQDIELFNGTIAQNIARFDPSATSEEVIAAATTAGVHDMIVHMPNGYESAIGPNGRNLSAGQRQRIALARALFRDPFLIVLDEPNSNLDVSGDLALNSAIARARQRGAIVVMVAHRPSALVEVEKLLWLEAGRVRAFGNKADVLPMIAGGGAARPQMSVVEGG